MLTIFLQGFLLLISLLTLLWIVGVFIKDASIVDIFWGMTFIVLNFFYFFVTSDFYTRKIILLILVTLWGVRLSLFLALRNIGKGEDYRYQEFRKKYGPERYWWVSFFQVYLLQGIFSIVISVTLLGINFSTKNNDLNLLDYLGIIVWVIGFIFEAGGDYQLAKFKGNPENKGKVLNTGFWKYTRHPNYFGDAAVWWSYAIFSIAAGSYWTIIGAVVMTFLLLKVSGVALLEKSLKAGKPEYNEYVKRTSSFLPWFPKQ